MFVKIALPLISLFFSINAFAQQIVIGSDPKTCAAQVSEAKQLKETLAKMKVNQKKALRFADSGMCEGIKLEVKKTSEAGYLLTAKGREETWTLDEKRNLTQVKK